LSLAASLRRKKMDYPKAKYSKTAGRVVVNNLVEEKALKGEWFDTPDFKNNAKPTPPPAQAAHPAVPPVVKHPEDK
jgi:hypothetical protein